MARLQDRLRDNAEGTYFVDSSCINCSACRHFAPAIFAETTESSYVKVQPETPEQMLHTQQALLSCPTASIGMQQKQDLSLARKALPMKMAEQVYLNGYNHRDAYGAHSYFIASEGGNWLIDSPRFVPDLVNAFESLGGLRYIFLSHRDDVAEAHRYAQHFGAERIIHRFELSAQPDAEVILDGEGPWDFGPAQIHFVPGHTRGHLLLLWDERYVFSGDHFAWIPRLQRFGSFRNACWYSWEKQMPSVQKMAAFHKVEWVFPGHGQWGQVPAGNFPAIVDEAVRWMKTLA